MNTGLGRHRRSIRRRIRRTDTKNLGLNGFGIHKRSGPEVLNAGKAGELKSEEHRENDGRDSRDHSFPKLHGDQTYHKRTWLVNFDASTSMLQQPEEPTL